MMWHNGFGGGFGILWLAVYIILIVIPVAKILGRLGFSQWWAAVAIVPVVNLIFLWVMAFSEWPRNKGA
jgi:uncharacterized membrane protein